MSQENFNSPPKSFDFLVFIGRFQPFHLGHRAVVQAGLDAADKVIVLLGSAHRPRSTRDPWSVEEREAMLRSTFSAEENRRIITAPLMDRLYNDEGWVRNVQATVHGLVVAHYATPHRPAKIGLIGHGKDHSSYYLNLFPQWGSIGVDSQQQVDATTIRNEYFTEKDCAAFLDSQTAAAMMPASVRIWLEKFCHSSGFDQVQREQLFVQSYRQGWKDAPYAPTFVTVDALVVQSGHLLMVTRKAFPGEGLLALPGGFLGPHERLEDACLRELKEETRLKVPAPVLRGSIKRREVFDDPYRSARGRTITHAFYMELAPSDKLPKVKGGDDARHAAWIPLAELDPNRCFEDHYYIIQEMIGG